MRPPLLIRQRHPAVCVVPCNRIIVPCTILDKPYASSSNSAILGWSIPLSHLPCCQASTSAPDCGRPPLPDLVRTPVRGSPAKAQLCSGSTFRSRLMGEKSKRKTRNASNTTARYTLAVAENFQLFFAAVGQHQFAAVVELGKPEIFIDQRLVESEVSGRLAAKKSCATSRPCRRSGLLSS